MFPAIKAYEKLNSYENIFMPIWESNNLAKDTGSTKCPDCYSCFELWVSKEYFRKDVVLLGENTPFCSLLY